MSTPPVADALVAAVRAAFVDSRDVVLQAPPGAGKSTIVPLALLREPWVRGRKILMLEPRRLAARAVALRMADTLGERVGETVGYRMRLDTRVSAATRIEVITEGVLTRMLHSDPALEGVALVIFDEFHERSLAGDLGLALCLDARLQLDASFRLLVMSATVEGARVAELIGAARRVEVPGRMFPVEIRYVGQGMPTLPSAAESPERLVVATVRRVLEERGGDVLVFLPGAGEIRRVQQALQSTGLPAGAHVMPLYGELAGDAQDAVLRPPAAGERRVVLATNIAETSLTIPGVSVVVDSGLVRRARFDPVSGMGRLELMRISRASADQRAGRAGRTAPGLCYRLWSEGSHVSLAAHTPAEILEADLAPLALDLANWGESDASRLRWLDAPPAPMLAQARELLQRLEALDVHGRITVAGREIAGWPLHPRLAHMLRAARELGAVPLAADLAALLSERDLLPRSGERDPDLRTRLDLLHRGRGGSADSALLQRLRRTTDQLRRLAGDSFVHGDSRPDPGWIGVLLAQAFPDRIGQRREGGQGRFLLANGRGASFRGANTLVRSEYIVAVEVDDQDREARIDLAAPLSRAEIEQHLGRLVRDIERVAWDSRAAAVVAHRQRTLGALVLDDKPLPHTDPELQRQAMLSGVAALGLAVLPWDDDIRNLRARLEFVRNLVRNDVGAWPASDDASLLADLSGWLTPWLAGVTRRDHLSRIPLAEALQNRLTRTQRQQLDSLAPRTLRVPSGSQIAIDYRDDNAPCIEVRLHEVFGLADTPRIGGGTVPITFKLLSPARRPVQITRDLGGFWRSSYLEVRKEMRSRYPRHDWPEDPASAAPSVRSTKRSRR